MNKKQNSDFFELLCKNDKIELENFLILKGKGPKPICPIEFVKEKKEGENEENGSKEIWVRRIDSGY